MLDAALLVFLRNEVRQWQDVFKRYDNILP